MQRFYRTILDINGNPATGATCTVYQTGTSNLATIYTDSSTSDNPSSVITNPVVTGSDGRVAFAINDGDYDLAFAGSNVTPETWYRYNLFDSTTATTVPVSSISLAMPSQYTVVGSPGTAITVNWNAQTANTVFAGPVSAPPGAPTFRALVAADVNLVAVDLTTAQTAAGNKIWSGTATFNAAVTNNSTLAQVGTSTFTGDVTFSTNTDLIFDKTSKGCIGAAGTYGYKSTPFLYDGSTAAGTAPTIAGMQAGIRKWSFSAAATNEMIFCLSLPHDYAEGTDIIPYIAWTTGGTNAGVTRWGMEYTLAKAYSQDTFPANTTIYVETAGSGIALRPVTSSFAAITGTGLEPQAIIVCRMFRDGAHGNDTQSDVTFLLDFGIKYQTSRPFGSKNSTPNFYT